MAETPALDRLTEHIAIQEGKPFDQARREAGYAVELFTAILALTDDDGPPPQIRPFPADERRGDLRPRLH